MLLLQQILQVLCCIGLLALAGLLVYKLVMRLYTAIKRELSKSFVVSTILYSLVLIIAVLFYIILVG